MTKEENEQKPSLFSNIEREHGSRLEKVWALFRSNHERYGSAEMPTKEGFIELAKMGKDVWNSWRERYPEPIPDFSSIDFRENSIDFSKFSFPSKGHEESCVDFSQAVFGDNANFMGTNFGHKANFSNANFGDFALFYNAFFGNETNFQNASFSSAPYFAKAKFGRSSNFDGAIFGGAANFNSVAFGDFTTFKGAFFSGWSDFSASTETNEDTERKRFQSITFAGTKFQGDARFTGRAFESTTDFGWLDETVKMPTALAVTKGIGSLERRPSTEFRGIPNFHGCKFHQDTNFDSAEFMAPPSSEAARAYRTLKLAMEQLKATREEQKFFRLEMKAEHPGLSWGKRCISTLYDLFSDYGFSLFRPALWLLALSLLFGASYGVLADLCAADQECAKSAWHGNVASVAERTTAVLKYTLASAAPVPGLDKMQTELRAPLFGQHGWIAIASLTIEILHKIIAIALTFLFALALRNLFKMKS